MAVERLGVDGSEVPSVLRAPSGESLSNNVTPPEDAATACQLSLQGNGLDELQACQLMTSRQNGFVLCDQDGILGEQKTSRRSGGVGRRKQCRPTRVCVEETDDLVPSLGGEFPREFSDNAAQALGEEFFKNIANKDGQRINFLKSSKNDFEEIDQPFSQLAVNGSTTCDLCGHIEQSETALVQHVEKVHSHAGGGNGGSEEAQTGPEYPTKYHQLGRELQHEAVSNLERRAAAKMAERLSPVASDTPVPVRDNERTTPSDPSPVEVNSKRKYSTKSYSGSRSSGRDQEVRPSHDTSAAIDLVMGHGRDPDIGLSRDTAVSQCQSTLISTSAAVQPQKPTPMSNSLYLLGSSTIKSETVCIGVKASDTEDYCEHCQKHFCNKYYLRKHKQDVHGLSNDIASTQSSVSYADQLPTSQPQSNHLSAVGGMLPRMAATTTSAAQSLPYPSIIANLPFVLPYPTAGGSSGSLVLPPQPQITSPGGGLLGAGVIPGMTSMASLMFLNPFASPLTILKTSPFLQGGQNFASSSLNTLAELQNANNHINSTLDGLKNGVGGSLFKFDLQPPQQLPADKASLCELCRKEFCNSYFLKVHKRDKHGIPMEPTVASTLGASTLGTKVGLPSGLSAIGGLPLSLTGGISSSLSESIRLLTAASGEEPGEKISTRDHQDKTGRATEEKLSTFMDKLHSAAARNDDVCCLCKKQFSNR